jgi:hypothetical protein
MAERTDKEEQTGKKPRGKPPLLPLTTATSITSPIPKVGS